MSRWGLRMSGWCAAGEWGGRFCDAHMKAGKPPGTLESCFQWTYVLPESVDRNRLTELYSFFIKISMIISRRWRDMVTWSPVVISI